MSSHESSKEGFAERNVRRLRNFKLLGAVAFGGASLVAPALAVPLEVIAGWHAAEAGGLELGRRHMKKKRTGHA